MAAGTICHRDGSLTIDFERDPNDNHPFAYIDRIEDAVVFGCDMLTGDEGTFIWEDGDEPTWVVAFQGRTVGTLLLSCQTDTANVIYTDEDSGCQCSVVVHRGMKR